MLFGKITKLGVVRENMFSSVEFWFRDVFSMKIFKRIWQTRFSQHGPEMAEAFVLDKRHSYTIAY